MDPIAVLITAADHDEASRIAEMLVTQQLAACVQILPAMEAVYRWEGKIERQPEILLLVKTVTSRFHELEQAVRAIHSYQTPEIVALPIIQGSNDYLKWLIDAVNSSAN
jgi:periplasmic divalent cation tolerance protein